MFGIFGGVINGNLSAKRVTDKNKIFDLLVFNNGAQIIGEDI